MRLFIDTHYFISVLKQNDTYNCQVMNLIHGMGMYPATVDEDQTDVVSSIVYDKFSKETLITNSLEEVFKFHESLVIEINSFVVS